MSAPISNQPSLITNGKTRGLSPKALATGIVGVLAVLANLIGSDFRWDSPETLTAVTTVLAFIASVAAKPGKVEQKV